MVDKFSTSSTDQAAIFRFSTFMVDKFSTLSTIVIEAVPFIQQRFKMEAATSKWINRLKVWTTH